MVNYLMVLGIVETVAPFVLVFLDDGSLNPSGKARIWTNKCFLL